MRLYEDILPSSTSPLRVDRERRVIRRIKILGWNSLNGRRYLPEAARRALHLYSGVKAYANHPKQPTDTRSVEDLLGVWRDPVWKPDGIYADLHYYSSHPLARRIVEDAERGLGGVAMSHNSDGVCETDADGTVVVTEITEVRSVDCVTDAAAVKNLWESWRQRGGSMRSISRIIRSNRRISGRARGRLLEAASDSGMGDEVALVEPDDMAGDGDDKRQAVADCIGKLVSSSDPEAHELARKMMAFIKPGELDDAGPDDDEDEQVPAAPPDDLAGDEDDDAKKPFESRRSRRPARGSRAVTESVSDWVARMTNTPSKAEVDAFVRRIRGG
jgi:hypothetical protein